MSVRPERCQRRRFFGISTNAKASEQIREHKPLASIPGLPFLRLGSAYPLKGVGIPARTDNWTQTQRRKEHDPSCALGRARYTLGPFNRAGEREAACRKILAVRQHPSAHRSNDSTASRMKGTSTASIGNRRDPRSTGPDIHKDLENIRNSEGVIERIRRNALRSQSTLAIHLRLPGESGGGLLLNRYLAKTLLATPSNGNSVGRESRKVKAVKTDLSYESKITTMHGDPMKSSVKHTVAA